MGRINSKIDYVLIGKPVKKYRVIVRELETGKVLKESSRSFMIYDYVGDTDIDIVKARLLEKEKMAVK